MHTAHRLHGVGGHSMASLAEEGRWWAEGI